MISKLKSLRTYIQPLFQNNTIPSIRYLTKTFIYTIIIYVYISCSIMLYFYVSFYL